MFDWLLYLIRPLFAAPMGEAEPTTTATRAAETEIPDLEPNAGLVIISDG